MSNVLQYYTQDDDGAVTVDWILLTAFGVGLVLSVSALIGPGVLTTAVEMNDRVSISTSF